MQTAPVCSRCGTPAELGEAFCGECGQTLFAQMPPGTSADSSQGSQNWTPVSPRTGAPPRIRTYLVPAIFSVFFCFPLAIPAIVFAAQVNARIAAGDIQGATDASRKAKIFSFIGLGFTLLVILMYAAFFLLAIIGSIGRR